VGDLPSHACVVSLEAPGLVVAAEFERRPDLPGVIVCGRDGRIAAMISRGLFFQRLSRAFSREIYLRRALQIFLDERLPSPLVLPANRRIAEAAVQALDRPMEHAYEPIVLQGDEGEGCGHPRLIDVYVLLRAQAHLLGVAHAAMLQSEKLASVGQLAAGVAHEINNPLAFVSNNLAVLARDARALAEAGTLFRRGLGTLASHDPKLHAELTELDERIDLAYTAGNLPELADRSREGLRRIQEIVRDLREFARLDIGEETDVDLAAGISSTANILAGRAKAAEVDIELEVGPVPTVPGNPGKLNQVLMNLMANAVDACAAGGRVVVRTRRSGQCVLVEVEDNGKGIDPLIADRIFDPFFTTKPIGGGTGMGLTISYGIVRDHGGAITFESAPGRGSTFCVSLPVEGRARTATGAGGEPDLCMNSAQS
jgi:signal transduction histidine kinase